MLGSSTGANTETSPVMTRTVNSKRPQSRSVAKPRLLVARSDEDSFSAAPVKAASRVHPRAFRAAAPSPEPAEVSILKTIVKMRNKFTRPQESLATTTKYVENCPAVIMDRSWM